MSKTRDDLRQNSIIERSMLPKQLDIEPIKRPAAKDESYKPIFARHETFHPRYGWLKKAYDAVEKDSNIFNRDDAATVLGVGKNMVQSMRYWATAFKIIKELPNARGVYENTPFGKKLLDNYRWDPYLEDPASLWLLHWNLLKPVCTAATWWFVFNEFHRVSFTQSDLVMDFKKYKNNNTRLASVNDSSLIKDINCLLRMYVRDSSNKKVMCESIDCPFAEISLLENSGDFKYFSFNLKKYALPPEIIVAACLEYISALNENAKTISVSRLLHEPNSPGLVFKLTESFLCNSIEQIPKKYKVSLSEAGGLLQFSFGDNPTGKTNLLIEDYYKHERK